MALAPPAGLCDRCVWQRRVAGARSTFVLCRRSLTDPRFPKYPPLPVVACVGFTAVAADEGTRRPAADPAG
jgi:hypothetical protein